MKPLRDDEPRQIGPYRVLAELGEGGMGRVLLAAADDGRLVALKVMRAHLLHDDRFRFRFRREVLTSREVAASPWTAAVVASDEHAPEPWLASEFFHGPTLAEAVDANGPLDEAAARRLMHGLVAALAEIHGYGVVHRDLKPSNVILTEDGVRVIDFGIARVPGASGSATTVTETGALIGAPAFMSPEQITKRPLGPATDLFSLGTTVITAATGANPFEADTLFAIMSGVVHRDPDLSGLPEGLRALVGPCMRKDPEERVTAPELLARVGEPLAGPWPPGVAALDERRRAEVADLARRHGWDTRVRPDRTAFMFGPGFVAAEEVTGADATTFAYGPTPPPGSYSTTPPGGSDPSSPAPPGGPGVAPGGPPPPAPKPDRSALYKALATIAAVVLAGIVILPGLDGGGGDPTIGSDGETPAYDTESEDAYDADADWADDPTGAPADPVDDAAVGDCFWDYGDEDTADLEPSSCEDGSFEVVEVFHGTTDLDSCDGVDDVSTSVSSSSGDLVLCLSYLHTHGEIYHADVGECVYGRPDGDAWYFIDCRTGAFEVLERLEGESDAEACAESTYFNHWYAFTASESYLDVVLCLSMIYPDDIGYAELDNCMSMTGDPDGGDADYAFSDCDGANVYVTGRTDEYDAGWWCGDDGWSTWRSDDFPDHAYTVCWRYL
ncbi:serine/threonine protein kinase [Glycomyces sp. TRM65418]|uniref:serine/threonine protein kinase n=1 Tax=Glycomyces sp. TRM65418 TaxID=2867006 RepID=UPI001CE59FAB|nr:serine/threonine-protein kinase [Glycomyces sp. TRM65418]MCC3764592.1 serine/threonine protein kinase [Glycomyces sp. TRM65418]QZD54256.1 serine/threonine protein kinase [Glycomyces sp. TRM65418]